MKTRPNPRGFRDYLALSASRSASRLLNGTLVSKSSNEETKKTITRAQLSNERNERMTETIIRIEIGYPTTREHRRRKRG